METKILNPLLKETFLIRPTLDNYKGTVVSPGNYEHTDKIYRYANEKWILDDGQPDLAFTQGIFYFGVDIPGETNLLWAWDDIELTRSFLPEYLHKMAKRHHYYTVDDTPTDDGQYRWDYSNHPNKVATQSAMNKVCAEHGCANGILAHFLSEDKWDNVKWISDGLILIQSTMQPIRKPGNPTCYLCKDNGKGHIIEALRDYKEDLEYDLGENQKEIDNAKITISDCECDNKEIQEELAKVAEKMEEMGIGEAKE